MTSDPKRIVKKPYLLALPVLILSALASTQVYGQVAEGTLSGQITGTTGARIPSAHLSIKNTANGDTKTVTANQDGSFAIPNLSPGTYEITASAPGFAEARMVVTISAGVDQVADITMHSEGVGGADKGQGGTSGVSGVVSSKSVTDLPLNGRSASDLAALEPGVATARTQSSGRHSGASERK